MTRDIFRPHREPARQLYDAFQREATRRSGRSPEEWQLAERQAVWRAARDYAQQHGLPVLEMSDIEEAEVSAMCHVDYGAKWAYRIRDIMDQKAGIAAMEEDDE